MNIVNIQFLLKNNVLLGKSFFLFSASYKPTFCLGRGLFWSIFTSINNFDFDLPFISHVEPY